MRTSAIAVSVALVALFALAWAPAPHAADAPSAATTHHVHLQGFAFSPPTLTIAAGDSVAWHNHDSVLHTATSSGNWNTGDIASGATVTLTYDDFGTFNFFCIYHPSMTGTLTVSGPPPPGPDLVIRNQDLIITTGPQSSQVKVIVRNTGADPSGAFDVAVTYRYQGEDHLIGEAADTGLSAGGARSYTFNWNTLGKVGDFPVKAVADPEGAVEESDEGNNVATKTASIVVGGVPGTDILDPI